MGEKKFTEAEGKDAAAVESEMNEATTDVAVRPELGIGNTSDQTFSGNISLPYLGITHGVGKLAESGNFKGGDLVLGGEDGALICSVGESVNMVIVSYREFWKEYVDSARWTAGDRPQVFSSEQDAIDAGFTTKYDPVTRQLPTAPLGMTWLMLIEKPEEIESAYFCIGANDKQYAPAYFAVEKGAYMSVKDPFGMAVRFQPRPLETIVWDLSVGQRTAKSGNKSWVPKIKIAAHLSDEQIGELKQAFYGSSEG
jgi:hypothetical protein